MARLRQDCVAAKETLSSDTAVSIPVLLPNLHTEVRLTRAELEAMIRPALDETIVALRRAIRSANLDDSDISAVLLVGGSSRIPLVAQMVGAELGRPIAVDAHPKDAVAFGAATAVADLHHRMVTPESVTAVLPEHRALGPDQRAPRPGEPVEPVEPDDQPGRGGTGRRRLAVLGAAGVLAVVALSGLLWLAKPGSGGDASPPQSSVSSEFPDARDTPPTTVAQSSTAPETGVEAERISPDIAPFEGQIDALTPFANDLELYTGRDGVEGLEQEAALLGSWYALADWCAANGQGRVGVCYDRAATFLDQYFERDPRTINTQTWGAPGAVGGVIADTYELTNGYLGVDSQVLIPELMDNRPGDAVLCEPSCSDVLDG
jgi:hypothetical protein